MGSLTISSGNYNGSHSTSGQGSESKTITLSTANNFIPLNIKFTRSFTSLCNLSGSSVGNGNYKITQSGYYFPPNASNSGTKVDNYNYNITMKKPNATVTLSTAKTYATNDIKLNFNLSTTSLSNLSSSTLDDKVVYFNSNTLLVGAQSESSFSANAYTTYVFDNSGDIYVKACLASNITTSQINVWNYGRFQITKEGYVNRYGTGSPGSPYSYGGSVKAKLIYRSTQSSSSDSSAVSSALSGQSGYNASVYGTAWKYNSGKPIAIIHPS